MKDLQLLLGRIGLSYIFITSGWSKIGGLAGTQQYMEAMGVSGSLVYPVIALELLAGLAVLAGAWTRYAAWALALFSLATAVLFHGNLADGNEAIQFNKNLAIAGGFLALAVAGAGAWSLDGVRNRQPARGLPARG
ncbi:MAG TPA: DoxX family protein [Lysobacter sp.]|nr:DoxX family protein [Lysobacter sp.]